MIYGTCSGCRIERANEFRVMTHFLLHTGVFAADGAIYYGSAGFDCDAARCPWRHCAVDDSKSWLISPNIFYHFTHERLLAKGKTNVHDVGTLQRRRQINIYAKDVMMLFNDFKQRFAYFTKADNENGLAHLRQF